MYAFNRTIPVFTLLVLLILMPFSGFAGNVRVKSADVPASFRFSQYPQKAPTAFFLDEQENEISVSSFKGKILLVNIWSTACAQCVIELPMLDRLQKDMGGLKFQVLAVSAGPEPVSVIRRTWAQKGIKNLKVYKDSGASFSLAARILGLPTTLLIDEEGNELGRIRGMAEWDGPVIKAQIRNLIRQAKEKQAMEKPEGIFLEAEAGTPPESVPPPPSRSENDISNWFQK